MVQHQSAGYCTITFLFLDNKNWNYCPAKRSRAGINCRQLWKKFNQSIKYFTRQIPWIVQPDNANGISNTMPALDKNDNILWNLYKSFSVHIVVLIMFVIKEKNNVYHQYCFILSLWKWKYCCTSVLILAEKRPLKVSCTGIYSSGPQGCRNFTTNLAILSCHRFGSRKWSESSLSIYLKSNAYLLNL